MGVSRVLHGRASAAVDTLDRSPRRPIFQRIDKAGGSERVEGILGVQQLTRRLASHFEAEGSGASRV